MSEDVFDYSFASSSAAARMRQQAIEENLRLQLAEHVAQQAWSGYDTMGLKPVGGVYVAVDDAKFDKQIDGEVVR